MAITLSATLPSGTDLQNLGSNASGGQTVGGATSELISFYGVTGTAQLSAAAQATSAASWATVCATKAGFGTSDEAVTFFNTFRNIQHVLKTTGLWKGSA